MSKTSERPNERKLKFYQQPGFSLLRKLIHLGGSGFALIYLIAPRQWVIGLALATLALVLVVEYGRQHWALLDAIFQWAIGPALRQGEQSGLTAGVWSTLSILIALVCFPRPVAIPAILFAQLGDPAAEAFGRAFGRHHLFDHKTLEGSLGCLGVCLVVGLLCGKALSISTPAVILGALVATLVEFVPLPPNDNLYMAPLSGAVMVLVGA